MTHPLRCEVLGWPEGLNLTLCQAIGFYSTITLGMAVGLLNNFLGVINPIKMLVISAVINGLVATSIIAVIALLAANKTAMGEYAGSRLSKTFVWVACLGMAAAAIGLLLGTH